MDSLVSLIDTAGWNLIHQRRIINNCPIHVNLILILQRTATLGPIILLGYEAFRWHLCELVLEGWIWLWTAGHTVPSPLHACAGPDCHLHRIPSAHLSPSSCCLEAKARRSHRDTHVHFIHSTLCANVFNPHFWNVICIYDYTINIDFSGVQQNIYMHAQFAEKENVVDCYLL